MCEKRGPKGCLYLYPIFRQVPHLRQSPYVIRAVIFVVVKIDPRSMSKAKCVYDNKKRCQGFAFLLN